MVHSRSQAVFSDLRRTAGMFGAEAVRFWAIMPPHGPARADGGSQEFDGALAQVLEAIGALHTQMAAMIAQHGSSLRDACAGDQVADETAGDTMEEITDRRTHELRRA
jgi:hypothetical protein